MCDQFSANKMMIFMNIAPMKKRLYPSICCFFFLKIVISSRIVRRSNQIHEMWPCATNFFYKMTIFINMSLLKILSMCDHFSINKITIFNNIAPIEKYSKFHNMTIFINIAPIQKYSKFGNVRPIFLQ